MASVKRDRMDGQIQAVEERADDVAASDGEESDGGADADFGPLEVFDSNSVPAPYSSLATNRSSGNPERDKARETSHDNDQADPAPTVERSAKKKKKNKKHKKSHRRFSRESEGQDAPPSSSAHLSSLIPRIYARHSDVVEVPSTQGKKKRKLSDHSGGEKSRKRRRSREEDMEQAIQATQDDGNAHLAPDRPSSRDAKDSAFLRTGRDNDSRPDASIYEEGTAKTAPQDSPSAARQRRRSHSKEARSRGDSAHSATEASAMSFEASGEPLSIFARHSRQTVEDLAREALKEHLNGVGSQPDAEIGHKQPRAPDAAMDLPDLGGIEDNARDGPEAAAALIGGAGRRRSMRPKKAKPTFYEQPLEMEEEDPYPEADLQSPYSTSASARVGKKQPSKKKKLSRSMEGGDGEGFDFGRNTQKRQKSNAGFRTGRFSDDEFASMKSAIEAFKDAHDISQEEVNEMIQAPGGTAAGEMHAELWNRIFSGCPNRQRQKIINVARKNYHNFVARGTWTPEQDAEFSQLIATHGPKWSKIAAMVNRHPEDLRDRYRNYLVCGVSQRKDAWDETEESRLTQYVIQAMEVIDELRSQMEVPNPQLLEKSYEELIDWQSISERMDRTRSRLQCITKWKSLNIKTHGKDKLVSSQPDSHISFRLERARRQISSMPEEERYRLVLAIQGTAAGTEAKIPWQKLLDKQYRNQWHRSTLVLLWRRLKQAVPDWERKSVRDCAQHLLNQYNLNGELPDVGGEGYDDVQETAAIESASTVRKSDHGAGEKAPISMERVVESGDEMEEAEFGPRGNGAVEELQIDPALTKDEPPAPQALTEPEKTSAAAKKERKRATATRTMSGKRWRRPRVGSQDLVGDDAATHTHAGEHRETEDVQMSKKQESRKSKRAGGPASSSSPRAGVSEHSESLMDDMEDLPARI